jgi:phosphoribosylcarboxyaminoimidazole (NCAIR) mutase
MLNSCAVGIAVVNIDNGFGAGAMAARILAAGRDRANRANERDRADGRDRSDRKASG